MEQAQDDVVAATERLVSAYGKTVGREVLEAFGWTGGPTIPEIQRASYVNFVNGLMAGVPAGLPTAAASQPNSERVRPPLTWATPKPFDAFGGFFAEPADIADWQDTYFPR